MKSTEQCLHWQKKSWCYSESFHHKTKSSTCFTRFFKYNIGIWKFIEIWCATCSNSCPGRFIFSDHVTLLSLRMMSTRQFLKFSNNGLGMEDGENMNCPSDTITLRPDVWRPDISNPDSRICLGTALTCCFSCGGLHRSCAGIMNCMLAHQDTSWPQSRTFSPVQLWRLAHWSRWGSSRFLHAGVTGSVWG